MRVKGVGSSQGKPTVQRPRRGCTATLPSSIGARLPPGTPSAASLEAARRGNCAAFSAGLRHRPCLFSLVIASLPARPLLRDHSPSIPVRPRALFWGCFHFFFLPSFSFCPVRGRKKIAPREKAVNHHNETGGGVSCLVFIRGGNEHPKSATIGLVLISSPLTP